MTKRWKIQELTNNLALIEAASFLKLKYACTFVRIKIQQIATSLTPHNDVVLKRYS
jgi:hypothetical protein